MPWKDAGLSEGDQGSGFPLPGKPLHLLQHRVGFGFFPFLAVGQGQVAVKANSGRAEPDSLLKFLHRLVELTLFGVNDAQVIVSRDYAGTLATAVKNGFGDTSSRV